MREIDGYLNLSDILRIAGGNHHYVVGGWVFESVFKGPMHHRGRWASLDVALSLCGQIMPRLEGSIKALLE